MERAIDTAETGVLEEAPERVAIPRPRPNGTDTLESLGHVADRLVGGDRGRARAAAELEPLFAKQDEAESEPEPVDVLEARPGVTEPITRGADLERT
jgi:hypothetical protein